MSYLHQRGFTYLMVLWWVAISSVVLAALSQQWVIETRRQKEMELVFRGQQIHQALSDYFEAAPPGQDKVLPTDWHQLLEDTRRGGAIHHLRQLWPDPMTSRDWGVINEGPYIKGVFSTAPGRPLKAPDGVNTYSEWRFEHGQTAIRPD